MPQEAESSEGVDPLPSPAKKTKDPEPDSGIQDDQTAQVLEKQPRQKRKARNIQVEVNATLQDKCSL